MKKYQPIVKGSNEENIIRKNITLSNFKKDPIGVVEKSEGLPVAVLDKDKTALYCISAEAYEVLIEKLEDIALAQLVIEREGRKEIDFDINKL